MPAKGASLPGQVHGITAPALRQPPTRLPLTVESINETGFFVNRTRPVPAAKKSAVPVVPVVLVLPVVFFVLVVFSLGRRQQPIGQGHRHTMAGQVDTENHLTGGGDQRLAGEPRTMYTSLAGVKRISTSLPSATPSFVTTSSPIRSCA